MTEDIFQYMNKVEEALKKGLIEKEKGIIVFEGKVPILVSAPHSVEQLRKGKLKYGEGRTAPIAQFLHEKEDSYCAYKTMNFNDDANYDDKNYYKDELMEVVRKHNIKLLFDIHIMAPERENNIDIGTGSGRNILNRTDLLEVIKSNFQLMGIHKIEVDYVFAASFKNTVASTISRECQIPCFQIEINWRLLDETQKDNKLVKVIDALGKSIRDLKEVLQSDK